MADDTTTSLPYPWPWDGDLRPDRLALVVTGVQRVHRAASCGTDGASAGIAELSTRIRRAGGTVVHVRHTRRGPAPRPLLPAVGEEGWAPVLRPGPGDLLVDAAGHDGFHGSGLDDALRSRGLELLAVVGFAAEVTVSGTVRSANDRGYECLTVTDACAPLDPDTGARCLHSVTMSGGIFGAVAPAAYLAGLLSGSHPAPDPITTQARTP